MTFFIATLIWCTAPGVDSCIIELRFSSPARFHLKLWYLFNLVSNINTLFFGKFVLIPFDAKGKMFLSGKEFNTVLVVSPNI